MVAAVNSSPTTSRRKHVAGHQLSSNLTDGGFQVLADGCRSANRAVSGLQLVSTPKTSTAMATPHNPRRGNDRRRGGFAAAREQNGKDNQKWPPRRCKTSHPAPSRRKGRAELEIKRRQPGERDPPGTARNARGLRRLMAAMALTTVSAGDDGEGNLHLISGKPICAPWLVFPPAVRGAAQPDVGGRQSSRAHSSHRQKMAPATFHTEVKCQDGGHDEIKERHRQHEFPCEIEQLVHAQARAGSHESR